MPRSGRRAAQLHLPQTFGNSGEPLLLLLKNEAVLLLPPARHRGAQAQRAGLPIILIQAHDGTMTRPGIPVQLPQILNHPPARHRET